MSDDKIRTGLWKKDGPNGSYYGGKVEIDGVQYWVNLYKNERKESDKHPDLNLQLKPVEARQAPPPSRPGRDVSQRGAPSAPPPADPFGDDIPW